MGQKAAKPLLAPLASKGVHGRLLTAPVLLFSLLLAIIVLGLAAWVVDHQIDANNYPALERSISNDTAPNFPQDPGNDTTVSNSTQDDGGDYGTFDGSPTHLSRFEGNGATSAFLNFALSAGVVAVASYIVGLHHLRVRTTPSLSTAQGAAWIAFLLLMLPFALAWKEIALRGRGVGLIVLEAFVILLTVVHFLYTLLLYAGDR